jgi:hypothetical protein
MEQKVPEKPIVRWLGGNHYFVSSRTRPGHGHHIDTFYLTCSCDAGRYSRRCWALRIALLYEEYRKGQLARTP